MVGPRPDGQVREDNGDWDRRRGVWPLDPADKSQVPSSPSPLIPSSRYGREEEGWSQWREVGLQFSNPRTPKEVELSSGHPPFKLFFALQCALVLFYHFHCDSAMVQCAL